MSTYSDPLQDLPAPSDFEFEDTLNSRQNRRIMLLEHHIKRLESALTATVRAVASSQTMEAAWFDEPAERHLARAAQVLGLNLADLGLKYTEPADGP